MRRRAIRWVYVAAVLVFLQSIRQYHHRNTGFTELIDFGDQFYEQSLPAVQGAPRYIFPRPYRSPDTTASSMPSSRSSRCCATARLDQALDTPQYRARRILFSWTAYVIGLGQPNRIIKVYAAQNIVAWLLLAWILLRWFPPTSARHFVAWFGCLYGIGMAVSFRFALLEGPRDGDHRPGRMGDGAPAIVAGRRPARRRRAGPGDEHPGWLPAGRPPSRASGARGPRSPRRA